MNQEEFADYSGVLPLVREAELRPEDPRVPARFTSAAIILGIIGAVGLLAMFVINRLLSFIGLFVFGVLFIAGLIKFVLEAMGPTPHKRASPEQAIRAYLWAIRQHRWDSAAACLSWFAKQGKIVKCIEIPELDIPSFELPIRNEKDIATYWNEILSPFFTTRGKRFFTYKIGSARYIGNDVAVVPVKMRMTLVLETAAYEGKALQKSTFEERLMGGPRIVQLSATWPAYQREGIWYLLAAGLPEFAQVVRLSE